MFPSLMSLTVAVPSPLLETSSTELSRGPRTKITAETATMATTTTVMARNRLRFLVKSIGVSSSFSKRKSIKQPKLGGFFKKQKSFFATLYTKSVEKATGNRCFLAFPYCCGNLGPLLQ